MIQRHLLLKLALLYSLGCVGHPKIQPVQSTNVDLLMSRGEQKNTGDKQGILSKESPLSRARLIQATLSVNPQMEVARQAILSVTPRSIQRRSLSDPRIKYQVAPGGLFSDHREDHRGAQFIQVSQKFPWFGKRDLRGAIASSERLSEEANRDQVRLKLALTASLLFDDYYVNHRTIQINEAHTQIMKRLLSSVEARYESGRGSQSDVLRVKIEIAQLKRRGLHLLSQHKEVITQINGLLHLPPASPLPSPPRSLDIQSALSIDLSIASKGDPPITSKGDPSIASKGDPPITSGVNLGASQLIQYALRGRPELRFTLSEVKRAQIQDRLTALSSLPDFILSGTYNSMWPSLAHQFMIGISIQMPLYSDRLEAEREEAHARVALSIAKNNAQSNQIRVEVQRAVIIFKDSVEQEQIYRTQLLPLAHRQVSMSEVGYQNGKMALSLLIDAERSLKTLELEHERAITQIWRARARLLYSLGVPLSLENDGGNTPVQNAPVRNAPVRNAPVRNAPVQNASVRNAPVQRGAR